MRFLRKIWEDIRSFKNTDIYIGMPLAFLIAVLGVLSPIPVEWVLSATLAVLGIVLGSLLSNRWSDAELKSTVLSVAEAGYSADNFFHDFDRNSFSGDIVEAERVLLWSTTFNSTINDLRHSMEAAIRNGVRIQVLLLDPDAPAIPIVVLGRSRWDEQRFRTRIQGSLEWLSDFSSVDPAGCLQVRLTNELPSWSMIAIYPQHPTPSRMMIRLRARPVEGQVRPAFTIDNRRSPESFHMFEAQFDTVWKSAKDWSRSEPKKTS